MLSPAKPRSSNLEWLRIVSMIFIIAHHLGTHSVFPEAIGAFNRLVQTVCHIGGKLGVNCFVLISGYFLLQSRFRWRKVARLVVTVWVYSVGLYLGLSLGGGTFDWAAFGRACFPLIYNQYWFMTAYVIAYLLSPFVAIMLRACTCRQHTALLALLFVLASLLDLLPGVSLIGSVGWFLFLMALGAYIARYPRYTAWLRPWMAFAAWAVLWVVIVAARYWGGVNLFAMQNPVCLVWSLLLFVAFANARIPTSRLVNGLAAGTLGVYLIHDNNYVRPLLWNDWLQVGRHAQRDTFVLFVLVAVALVWVACTLADGLRRLAFAYVGRGLDALWRRTHPVETPLEPPDCA